MPTATGSFDAKLAPLSSDAPGLGRLSIDKEFHGDLTGTSKGEMLAIRTATPNSAGYVAMETVTGTLQGRTGTFSLQHNGIMNRGAPTLNVTVVPDSGTGELTALAGSMQIIVEGKEHKYIFEYSG
jgi:Protein of unknown function (DUF3224)